MGTPIRHLSQKLQASFVGEIFDGKIKCLLHTKYHLSIIAFKWVLGKYYVMDLNQHRFSMNVISQFIVALLDLDIAKQWIIELF